MGSRRLAFLEDRRFPDHSLISVESPDRVPLRAELIPCSPCASSLFGLVGKSTCKPLIRVWLCPAVAGPARVVWRFRCFSVLRETGDCLAASLWQRERDHRIAEPGAELAVTAGGNHDELLAVGAQPIGHRHRLSARREPPLP